MQGVSQGANKTKASVKLVECVIRKNGNGVYGLYANIALRGGTISESGNDDDSEDNDDSVEHGVLYGGKITVVKVDEEPQTVSKRNSVHNWHIQSEGEIIGMPQEKINVLYASEAFKFHIPRC